MSHLGSGEATEIGRSMQSEHRGARKPEANVSGGPGRVGGVRRPDGLGI